MQAKTTIKILSLSLIIIFSLWAIIAPLMDKPDLDKYRKTVLQELKDLLTVEKTTDLYEACKNTNKCVFIPYLYFEGFLLVNLRDFCKDRETFDKYVRYKVIKVNDSLFGIIELEHGIKDKYFYLILNNGKIIKLEEPVLKEQESAKSPPELYGKDIVKIIESLKSETHDDGRSK